MKRDLIHARCRSAEQMEMGLMVAGFLGLLTAILVFLNSGWAPGFAFLLLSLLAFGLARLLDMVADILACVGRIEETGKPDRPPQADTP